jgi:hypothetical protein
MLQLTSTKSEVCKGSALGDSWEIVERSLGDHLEIVGDSRACPTSLNISQRSPNDLLNGQGFKFFHSAGEQI